MTNEKQEKNDKQWVGVMPVLRIVVDGWMSGCNARLIDKCNSLFNGEIGGKSGK